MQTQWDPRAQRLGRLAMGVVDQQPPLAAIQSIAVAQQNAVPLTDVLDKMLQTVLLNAKKGSLASTRCAMAHWYKFALVTGYAPGETLPPKQTKHVLWWLLSFRNAKTARNCVGALRSVSIQYGMGDNW